MIIEKFKELPIMGILRGLELETVEPLIETIYSSGLRTIEVTMNTPEAEKIIDKAVACSNGRLTIGAGTVLDIDSLKRALGVGATFIVSPILIAKIAKYCLKKSIPYFPGAFTPLEIYQAKEAGAAMVKVFPAKFFGPAYLKEIKGPFQDVELLACGGVTSSNICSFFYQGASAIAFGASIFKDNLLKNKNFSSIEESIAMLIKRFKEKD